MKSYFTKKEQIVILIVIGVIVIVPSYKFLSSKRIVKAKEPEDLVINVDNPKDEDLIEDDNDGKVDAEVSTEEFKVANGEKEVSREIIVHISGEVKNPGIVELTSGKRLIDAVELLGGLTGDADANRINLAKKLQDEEKIYIPKIGEEIDASLVETPQPLNETPGNDEGDNKGNNTASSTGTDTEKIDINTCTKESLNTLPGIGETLSTRIIEYREENLFNTIDDIMNVSGIGDKKFEGLKDLIIVK